MNNNVTIVNNILCLKLAKRVNLKYCQHIKKVVTIRSDEYVNQLEYGDYFVLYIYIYIKSPNCAP